MDGLHGIVALGDSIFPEQPCFGQVAYPANPANLPHFQKIEAETDPAPLVER